MYVMVVFGGGCPDPGHTDVRGGANVRSRTQSATAGLMTHVMPVSIAACKTRYTDVYVAVQLGRHKLDGVTDSVCSGHTGS